MILASAAAVLLAVVLLVVGLLQPALNLVYGSITISLLAFGLLAVVVRQHRDDPRELPSGGRGDVGSQLAGTIGPDRGQHPGMPDLNGGPAAPHPDPPAPPPSAWQRPPT